MVEVVAVEAFGSGIHRAFVALEVMVVELVMVEAFEVEVVEKLRRWKSKWCKLLVWKT